MAGIVLPCFMYGLFEIHYDRSPSNQRRFHEIGVFCCFVSIEADSAWNQLHMWIPETTLKHLDIPSTGTIDWNWKFMMWFPQLDKDQWYWVVLSSPCWLCLFRCTGTPSSCIVWNQTTPWKMNRCFFQNLAFLVDVNIGESEGCFFCRVTLN